MVSSAGMFVVTVGLQVVTSAILRSNGVLLITGQMGSTSRRIFYSCAGGGFFVKSCFGGFQDRGFCSKDGLRSKRINSDIFPPRNTHLILSRKEW